MSRPFWAASLLLLCLPARSWGEPTDLRTHKTARDRMQTTDGPVCPPRHGAPPDEAALRKGWLNPPPAYRMNRNLHDFPLDPAGQDALIRVTLDDGWGGFALNTPFREYLTDKGMKATKRFCEAAKAEGMDLWLYDERGYPSGNAGDLVIKEDPSWECMGLFFKHATVTAGPVTFEMPPGKPVRIVAFPVREGKPDCSKPTDLTALYDGARLKWTAPAGTWVLFAATKHPLYEGFQAAAKGGGKVGARYPSLMVPEVTEAFLRITHEKYARGMGQNLGKYFTSTFTDEPSLMAVPFHSCKHKHAVVPWKEVLSREMQKRHGYRPEEKLVELYFDDGPVGQKVRYQYFHTVGDLIARNYFGKIKTWCEAHRFRSGGHLLLEETMIAHVPLYGNIMQCFRAMHAPGIDILSCYPRNMPVHSPKLAASAAELAGHRTVMSEPCPVADRTPTDRRDPPTEAVRGHLNLLLLGGVTDFNCYLRLNRSNREEKRQINTYVGRVNWMLQGGDTASDIGVVYPIESLWTKFTPRYHKVSGWNAVRGATPAANQIDQTFQGVSRFLFEHRWEYTHLDAKALMDGKAEGGRLIHRAFQFRVIVLPSVSTLPAEAWARLLEYAKQGGKILALRETPLNSDARFPDAAVRDAFAKLIRTRPNVVFMKEWTGKALEKRLATWLERPVRLEDETLPLRLAHRRVRGEERLFLVNDSAKEARTRVIFRVPGNLEEWDPATGRVRSVPNRPEILLRPYHGKVYRTR